MKIHLKKANSMGNLCGGKNRTVGVNLKDFKNLPTDRMCKKCAAKMGIYL